MISVCVSLENYFTNSLKKALLKVSESKKTTQIKEKLQKVNYYIKIERKETDNF